MADDLFSQPPKPAPRTNVPELSVSELAFSLKKTLEDTYGRVRVRGELSKVKIHTSGHMYSDLKDADACLSVVCWKGTVSKLSVRPEEGLDVICTGRITTYPQRSNYQLVIESMELAGEGALLKMLEDRKKRLTGEGLFDPARKKQLPYLPEVIGVVTSQTGAVIRDILHRLEDRFPRHVLVWPVLVQGPGAADQITAAIRGFDAINPGGKIPRPDILIVARGGGSLEDLMPFNEENVVRAVAECRIPVISAVGHETDTTLIDFVSDIRAPTPTAAAEMAVPVRGQLYALVMDDAARMRAAMERAVEIRRDRASAMAARLGDPQRILESRTQRLDHAGDRLTGMLRKTLHESEAKLIRTASRISHPRTVVDVKSATLARAAAALDTSMHRMTDRLHRNLLQKSGSLRPPRALLTEREGRFKIWHERLSMAGEAERLLKPRRDRLAQFSSLLESYSFENVLKRGFVVVRDDKGRLITDAATTEASQPVELQFRDGRITATIAKGKA
jgi:exodeoxyribonuclease VII large subunit